ncbi:hypothetical protein [Bradyrhizobium centrosematis]|uniref:hypothetical protein n=1 Tax=Bradyrhizobium centrosematis TaxID=1300039 RepID=UPI002168FE0A|nr:hypothetical protein [Bradyrhizobium centrosematis]MCS3764970.1 hypothetical protein [Bradyrhizobium centrosematis]MCS3777754.1 hypothetical protein [Bradyrhizobium centrosematis]
MNGILKLKKAHPQRLKSLGLGEVWLQQQIASDPSLLGLGDLTVFQREKTQPTGGRIDFIMSDAPNETRYEIEIMLGATDPSHIIRTIEYWDMERQRAPLLEHRAVIVAEEITSRFFNVIRLLNRAIPMIAIQLSAFQFGDEIVLQFIRVLDTYEFGGEEDEESSGSELADRPYWEKRSRPEALAAVDAVVSLISKTGSEPKVTYNRTHIAVGTSGYYFAWFYPRKIAPHCPVRFKVGPEQRAALVARIEEAGLEAENRGQASIQMFLKPDQIRQHGALLEEVLRSAEVWSHR